MPKAYITEHEVVRQFVVGFPGAGRVPFVGDLNGVIDLLVNEGFHADDITTPGEHEAYGPGPVSMHKIYQALQTKNIPSAEL